MKLLSRYFHTLRYLRFIQWIGRIKVYLPKRIPLGNNIPQKRTINKKWNCIEWKKQSLFKDRKVKFLNLERKIKNKKDWSNPESKLIWLFNLHYFDGINSKGSEKRTVIDRGWIDLWINENPPCKKVAWNPYCTSLRIVNWIKWSLKGNIFTGKETKSLVIQIRWLIKNLEIQFLGNHYWSNGKALVFAGFYFDGFESKKWLNLGLKIIDSQLDEQCLSDGGHFERTPMYHALFLEDILDLINLSQIIPDILPANLQEKLLNKARKMLQWLYSMSHPDNEIAFFNDTTFGIGANFKTLLNYYKKITNHESNISFSTHSFLFKESGFVRLERNDMVCICDVGSINPKYNPGHSHAETLSFEMSFKKSRIIVNSGISVYGRSNLRIKQRSTSFHSTLCIDKQNSSDIWSGFRVGRRAKVRNSNYFSLDNNEIAYASHSGYEYLKGSPIHSRMWRIENNKLYVYDHIYSSKKHMIEINFIFHPKWYLEILPFNTILIKEKNADFPIAFIKYEKDLISKIYNSHWNKGFGISIINNVLTLKGSNESVIKKTFFSFDKFEIKKLLKTIY
ncbi:MAG: alginate lyase family protein [Prochlorococcus marinus XMU1428]|nr:alginate lyase family protein [Prochlorococcus marinus XMU1428]